MIAHKLLAELFALPRRQKRAVQVFADIVLISGSFVAAMVLRLDSFAFARDPHVWVALVATFPVSILVFARLGFYRAVIRYMGSRALGTILLGIAASASSLFLISQMFGLPVPRSVPFIYALVAFSTVGGVRFALRNLNQRDQWKLKTRVVIYGAGQSGRQLLGSLQHGPEYAPIAFVDDAPELHGTHIGGLKVYPAGQIAHLIQAYGAEAVLLAMPSESRARRAEIIASLEPYPVQVQTIPGMADLVTGRSKISEIGEVAIEDLLGRDPIPPREDLMSANIRDKVVMVTGAGGSIGSELCCQILRQHPRQLILFELSEYALYSIDQTLQEIRHKEGLQVDIVPILGSVQNQERIEAALDRFGVHTVYHAAAYKHVPLVEHNPVEGVRNNVFGTLASAKAAMNCGVEAFILVSTDKAVRPTNVMGASKRMAELVCQALANEQGGTRFSMVRFGNVLGSSGSVIPLFRRQIEAGGPVTVTHPEITRYFMTIPEAAQLVIQAGAMAQGGDVFVLDMGEPVRIADLAARMIRLSGLQPAIVHPGQPADQVPEGDIRIEFTALRPGEKLYEELLIGERATPTGHPKIMTASERYLPWNELQFLLDELLSACEAQAFQAVRDLLERAPTAYRPDMRVVATLAGAAEKRPVREPIPLTPRVAAAG